MTDIAEAAYLIANKPGTTWLWWDGHLAQVFDLFGYWVGVESIDSIDPSYIDEHYLGEVLEQVPDRQLESERTGRLLYLGSWYNEDTGLVDLDVVEWFSDLDEALEAARDHSQVAIYDGYNEEVIYV